MSNANVFVISSVAPDKILLIPSTATLLSSGSVLLLILSAVKMSSQILRISVEVYEFNLFTTFSSFIP